MNKSSSDLVDSIRSKFIDSLRHGTDQAGDLLSANDFLELVFGFSAIDENAALCAVTDQLVEEGVITYNDENGDIRITESGYKMIHERHRRTG